jgi:hypothetical protein
MSTESSTLKNARAALCLNNMGVTMLERGYFREATATFKDSLEIMRALMTPASPAPLLGSAAETVYEVQERRIQQKLQSGAAHLARTSQTIKTLLRSDIEICPLDEGDVSALRFALQCMSSPSKPATTTIVAFPVRLRCTAFEKSLDLQAATVLYNVGLAHLMAHLTARPTSSVQERLLTGALKNLSLAHSLFARTIQTEEASSSEAFQTLCAMLVSAMVLKNMFRIFHNQKQLSKAQQVLASLAMLEAAVDTSRHSLIQDYNVAPAA